MHRLTLQRNRIKSANMHAETQQVSLSGPNIGKPARNADTSFVSHRAFLITEALALLTRLNQVKAFGLTMPMTSAANISLPAQRAIHRNFSEDVMGMKKRILGFIELLQKDNQLTAEKAQKVFAILKLKFNWLLDSLDIFADVLTLRSEHDTGIWLSGMDALAEDTLRLKGKYYDPPPLITYLDRGHGAAIRRARTRLPGGRSNPVAVIRVPRERMISTGIASSLVHEVGHQGASLLSLVPSLRKVLLRKARSDPGNLKLWNWYERWISEILSDFWSVAMIGIGSTTGLINVVSVPSYFVFRLKDDDPHPPPWIRVRLSIAFGAALFPDRQWFRLRKLWNRLYPLRLAGADQVETYRRLEALLPAFTGLVVYHRPPKLKGKALKEVFPLASRQPARLRQLHRQWGGIPERMMKEKPSLVFAVIGQARADGLMSPEQENVILGKMLRAWALRRSIY
jgi:hypothetical protein